MADPVSSIGGFTPRPISGGLRPVSAPTGLAPLVPAGTRAAQQQAQQSSDRQAAVDKALANPDLPSWARDAIQNPNQRRSIGSQIGGVFSGLVPGLLHVGKEAGTDVGNLIPGALQVIKHHGLTGQAAPELGARAAVVAGGGVDPGPSVNTAHLFPLGTQTGQSFEQTAGRLAQLSPFEVRSIGGHHVNTFGDAYRQGNIVGTVLGDVGNVAMAGGAVAPLLQGAAGTAEGLGATRLAGRLGTASDVSSLVGRAGGRAANAPFEAVTGVLKGGKSLWRAAGQAGMEKLGEVLPAGALPMQTTIEGKLSKQMGKAAMNEPGMGRDWMTRNLRKDASVAGAPSMLEQEVGMTRAAGVAQADKMLSDRVGADVSLAAHLPRGREEPGRTMTREGQALAHAYENGTLPPEQMARIDAVTAAYKKQAAPVTQNALEGTGLLKGPMDPAYLGDAPIPQALDIALSKAGVSAQSLATMHDALNQGATLDDLAHVIPELHDVLLDPQIYPKAWRESMNVMAKGHELGQTDLPRTPAEMLAAGMERPTYMPTTESMLGKPQNIKTAPITSGLSTGLRGVANERHSATVGYGPYSLATAAEGLGKNISTTKFNSILQRYIADNRLPSVGDVLARDHPAGPVDLAQIAQEAERNATLGEVGNVSAADHAKAVATEYGRLINDHLQQRGYEVLPGNRANPQQGDFNPAKTADFHQITPDSVALPKGVKDSMVQFRTGADRNRLLTANRGLNMALKRNLLAFNAHWTAGDAIRNQLIGHIAGGVDPISMAKGMIDVKRLEPAIRDEIFNRPNFVTTGMRQQEATALTPEGAVAQRGPSKLGGLVEDHTGIVGKGIGKIGEGVRAAQGKSFKLNATVNGIQRQGWSLVRLERILKDRGLSSTSDLGSNLDKWHEPAVQKAINDTINESNHLFGALGLLSPLERRVMTQVFPFWGWMRHVTMLAARTAVDNPARMLWTLRLGAIGMNSSPQDMPSYLNGSIGMGGEMSKQRLGAIWANPFFDIGTGGLLGPGQAARSLSPLIKLGITATTNRDPNNNFNTVTHAPKTHPNPLASAAYQALESVPWTRAATNLAPTGHVPGLGWGFGPVKRYGSGQTEMSKTSPGTPLAGAPRWRGALGGVSVPLPNSYVPQKATTGTQQSVKRKAGLKGAGLSSTRKRGLKG